MQRPVVLFSGEIRGIVNIFSLVIGLGASLAVLWVVQSVPRWQAPRWANAGLLALLGALVGARLFYVFVHWGYFRAHLLEIAALWLGGFSWPGAVLGGLIALGFISIQWGTRFVKVADGLAPMIPPLVIAAWLACWLAGFAYGSLAPQDARWGVPAVDETGASAPRFPLQIAAAASMLIYAFVLEVRKPRLKEDGKKFAWMLFGLALNVLIFMPLRADPGPHWLDTRLDTWAALILFALSLAFLAWLFFVEKEEKPAGDRDRK